MKKILKNALIGFIVGLLLIPITFVELYYWGGEMAYIKEIVNFKNFINISIFMILMGTFSGGTLSLLGNVLTKFQDKEYTIKLGLSLGLIFLVYIVLMISILFYIPQILIFKFSEIIITLIDFNGCMSLIILAILIVINDSIRIQKINKKLKENK